MRTQFVDKSQDRALVFALAGDSGRDPRTVAKRLAGGLVRGYAGAAIEAAARARGIVLPPVKHAKGARTRGSR